MALAMAHHSTRVQSCLSPGAEFQLSWIAEGEAEAERGTHTRWREISRVNLRMSTSQLIQRYILGEARHARFRSSECQNPLRLSLKRHSDHKGQTTRLLDPSKMPAPANFRLRVTAVCHHRSQGHTSVARTTHLLPKISGGEHHS